MHTFYSLTVSDITSLTPNSAAVTFSIPDNLIETFSFKAGQFITIKYMDGDVELRRAYSISSSPKQNDITVGIKKVIDGTFSLHANTALKAGDVLEVMSPEGRFTYEPRNEPQHIAAFAAGSGITPIMSISRTALEGHPENTMVLVYGNQSLVETMFYKEILDLIQKYPDRFFVQFIYSRNREDESLFGRIEPSTVNFIIKNKFKDTDFDAFYLCGPEPMIESISETLKANNIETDRIYLELFTTEETEDELAEVLEGKTTVEVTLDDEVFSLVMDKKTRVLDAILDEGIDAPYSCQGGVCSTCIARLVEGKAEMAKNQILTDSEIEQGFILTCQAHPLTPKIKVDYDDV